MTKQWQNDAGYIIQLTLCATRSRVQVKDREGNSVLYREFEYWQRVQAEQEAEALAKLADAHTAYAQAA